VIERYRMIATRIRQEIQAGEWVVARAQRAVACAREHPADRDLYLDAAVLNLHDFYTGLDGPFTR
jgi:hypothetical protein